MASTNGHHGGYCHHLGPRRRATGGIRRPLKIKIMFKEAIERKIAELKVRRSKIADDLGLQRSEISSYLNGNRKLSVEKIEMVLAYLGAKIV